MRRSLHVDVIHLLKSLLSRCAFVLSVSIFLCMHVSFAQVIPVAPSLVGPPEDYYLVAPGDAVATGDLNGDGRDDLIVTTGGSAGAGFEYQLFVYLQKESGRLNWPLKYPAGNGMAVAIGDLNHDGRNDIVVSLTDGIGVFYQNSAGTWDPMIVYPAGHAVSMECVSLRVADINGDGFPDIICLYRAKITDGTLPDRFQVEVVLNNHGQLGSSTVVYTFPPSDSCPAGGNPIGNALLVGDLNNDGLLDIVVTNTCDPEHGSGFFLLLQNSDGSFAPPVYYSVHSTCSGGNIAIGDVNGDGLMDIVAASCDPAIYVYLQNRNGGLDVPIVYPAKEGSGVAGVVIADINNDGRQDVVVMGSDLIAVFVQSSDGTLTNITTLATANTLNRFQSLAVADINGDGIKEIVVGNDCGFSVHRIIAPGPNIAIQSALGLGQVQAGWIAYQQIPVFSSGLSSLSVTKISIEGEDANDFAILSEDCSGGDIASGSLCSVWVGFAPTTLGMKSAFLSIVSNDPVKSLTSISLTGEGVVAEQLVRPVKLDSRDYQIGDGSGSSVAIGDVNGDGRPDVVVASVVSGDGTTNFQLFVFLQDESGNLAPPVTYEAGDGVSVAIGDVNNDGRNDVVVSNGSKIGVLYQNEAGGLEPMKTYETGYNSVRRVRIGDLNHDGLNDIAIVGEIGHYEVAIFYQNAEGGFNPPITFPAYNIFSEDIELADINGDGLLDLLIPYSHLSMGNYQSALIYYQNEQGFLEMPSFQWMDFGEAQNIAVGDVNNDGFPDLVMAKGFTEGPAVGIAYGNRNGTLDPVFWEYTSSRNTELVKLGDVNGDGRLDVILNSGWGGVTVFLQDANGSLMPETSPCGVHGYPAMHDTLAVGDINGDGKDEIAVVQGNLHILSARELRPQQISSSPSSVDFGSLAVGQTSDSLLTISNKGEIDLQIGAIPEFATSDFEKIGDSCSNATIEPGKQCVVRVLFSPTRVGIAPAISLAIPSNDPATPILFIPLSGAGVGSTLTVIRNGSGSGSVTSDVGDIDCGSSCTGAFQNGAFVTLRAAPSETSMFSGWSGCSVASGPTCKVAMYRDQTVSARFTLKPGPVIVQVTPAQGTIATVVTITGNYFGASSGSLRVSFGGITAAVSSWTSKTIKCAVPAGVMPGTVRVVVTTTTGSSPSKTFNVNLPAIGSLSPATGTVGTTLTIAGTCFGPPQGISTVSFNGINAAVTLWTNATIKCTVPSGVEAGPVSVAITTGVGSSQFKTFTVNRPVISLLTPVRGAAGATVTITGNYFGPSQGLSTMWFGMTTVSEIFRWTNTKIVFKVPSDATTGAVTVTVTTEAGTAQGKTFTVKS